MGVLRPTFVTETMAYLMFIDESGQDHRNSPYEVLAGISVEDKSLWNLIREVQDAELRHFGVRYSSGSRELKASKILKSKTFRLANQLPPIPQPERSEYAKSCMLFGASAGKKEMTALAQAKLDYVIEILTLCSSYRCKIFASVIDGEVGIPDAPELLRKDYVYLFERFYYYLEDRPNQDPSGVIVFDELDKSRSHILVNQMDSYFKKTAKGRQRSSLIIPEPFFVHSDLTTGVQLADMVAYIISWGLRFGTLDKDSRPELSDYVELVKSLRYHTCREFDGEGSKGIWSIAHVR